MKNPDDDELDDHDIINVNDHDVLCRLAKPHRWSLLHHFNLVFFPSHYVVDFEYGRKGMLHLVVMEYPTILKLHGLQTPTVDIPSYEMADDYEPRMQAAIEIPR